MMGGKWDEYPIETILGTPPSKSNSYMIVGKRLIKTKKAKDYERDFGLQIRKYRNADIEGPIEILLNVYYPNRRSDLDGCTKILLDLFQEHNCFKNDNKVVHIELNKYLDKDNPRVEFKIRKSDRTDV